MPSRRYLAGSLSAATVILAVGLVPARSARTQPPARAEVDPLPSWNDTAPKKAITAFVAKVTKEGSPDFVPPAERVAVFDNDGTLWCEQPMYVQLAFALDRVKALADKHPEWKQKQPFKAVLENDIPALAKVGEKGLVELVMATHTGMSTTEFEKIASDWI